MSVNSIETKPLLKPASQNVSQSLAPDVPTSKTSDNRSLDDEQGYNNVSSPYLRSPQNGIKPNQLSLHLYDEPGTSACAVSPITTHSHLKAPSAHARSMHMDIRYSPYARQTYPMSSVAPTFLPHSHGHLYNFPSCNGTQPFSSTQAGFGYPPCVSVPTVVPASSDLGSLEVTMPHNQHSEDMESRHN